MLFKYRNSNINIHGTFELNEDGELIDYELYVPSDVPLLPIPLAITNIHTINLKLHGINRMKEPITTTVEVEVENSKTKTKYELVKYLLELNE